MFYVSFQAVLSVSLPVINSDRIADRVLYARSIKDVFSPATFSKVKICFPVLTMAAQSFSVRLPY